MNFRGYIPVHEKPDFENGRFRHRDAEVGLAVAMEGCMGRDGFPAKIRSLEPYAAGFDAFRLRADGCDVLFGCYPAGSEIPPHRHDTENWGVVTKGAMTIVCGGVSRRYEPGEWYHVPRAAEHWASCEADTELVEFWFAEAAAGVQPGAVA